MNKTGVLTGTSIHFYNSVISVILTYLKLLSADDKAYPRSNMYG